MASDTKYSAYNDLAWTEQILTSPEDSREVAKFLCETLKQSAGKPVKTLLHLGCGAGMYDFTFRKFFQVTGVDLSSSMLAIAQKINPGLTYIEADMREIRLKQKFDAVMIPDSIDYMTTENDLRRTIDTAASHLHAGGVLLVVANVKDLFRENNFAYSGSRADVSITVFENNYVSSETTYEATLIYLIRREQKLKIYTETHKLGLFDEETWNRIFNETGFEVHEKRALDTYGRFLLGNGEYRQLIFIGRKTKEPQTAE